MSIETAVNGVHTAHLVERYIGSAYDTVKAVAVKLPEIQGLVNSFESSEFSHTFDRGLITDDPTAVSVTPSIDGEPTGNKGDTGAIGPQGPQGAVGPMGPAGTGTGTGTGGGLGDFADSLLYTMTNQSYTATAAGNYIAFNTKRQDANPQAHYTHVPTTGTVIVIHGLFNIKVGIDLDTPLDTDTGLSNNIEGVELVAKVTSSTGNVVIYRDAVEIADSHIKAAQLKLDFYASGYSSNYSGDTSGVTVSETVEIFIAVKSASGTPTMKTIPASSYIFAKEIAGAPDPYVESTDNSASVSTFGSYNSTSSN